MNQQRSDIHIIPGNRLVTHEHETFLKYYQERIIPNSELILNSTGGGDYENFHSYSKQLDTIAESKPNNIESIQEKARLLDELFQTVKTFGVTLDSPIINLNKEATYAIQKEATDDTQQPDWRKFITDVIADFLRDSVMVIKESEPVTEPQVASESESVTDTQVDFPFFNSSSGDTSDNDKDKIDIASMASNLQELTIDSIDSSSKTYSFSQNAVKMISYIANILINEPILNKDDPEDVKLLAKFLFAKNFVTVGPAETGNNVLHFTGENAVKMNKIAQIFKILTMQQQNYVSILISLLSSFMNLEFNQFMITLNNSCTIYDKQNKNIARVFLINLNNLPRSSKEKVSCEISIGYITHFLHFETSPESPSIGFNFKNKYYLDLFNNNRVLLSDLDTFYGVKPDGETTPYFTNLINAEIEKIKEHILQQQQEQQTQEQQTQEQQTQHTENQESNQVSLTSINTNQEVNFESSHIEQLLKLLIPAGEFYKNVDTVFNFFTENQNIANKLQYNLRTPFQPVASKILPFFHDVLISNGTYESQITPEQLPPSFLFLDALVQLNEKLVDEDTKPFSQLLDLILVLDKDRILPILRELFGASQPVAEPASRNIPELGLGYETHEFMISIIFDTLNSSEPVIKLYTVFPDMREVHVFSKPEYSKLIPLVLIQNLNGSNLFIIFIGQQMELIKQKPGYKDLPHIESLLNYYHDGSSDIIGLINKTRQLNKMVRLFVYNQSSNPFYKSINLFTKMLFMKFLTTLNIYKHPDYNPIFIVFTLFALMFTQSPAFQPEFDYTRINEKCFKIIKEYSIVGITPKEETFFRSFASDEYKEYDESRQKAARDFARKYAIHHGGAIKTQKTTKYTKPNQFIKANQGNKYIKSMKKIFKKNNKKQSRKGNDMIKTIKSKKLKQKTKK